MREPENSRKPSKRLRTKFVNGSPESEMDWILALIKEERRARRTGELPRIPPYKMMAREEARRLPKP